MATDERCHGHQQKIHLRHGVVADHAFKRRRLLPSDPFSRIPPIAIQNQSPVSIQFGRSPNTTTPPSSLSTTSTSNCTSTRPFRFQSIALSVLFTAPHHSRSAAVHGTRRSWSSVLPSTTPWTSSSSSSLASASSSSSYGCACRVAPSDANNTNTNNYTCSSILGTGCALSIAGLSCIRPPSPTTTMATTTATTKVVPFPFDTVCCATTISTTGTTNTQPTQQDPTDGFLAASDASSSSCGIWKEPALLNKRIPSTQLLPLTTLSTGAFGDVVLGHWRSERVAIKRLSATKTHQTKANALAFATEIVYMAELCHPRISAFLGVEWSKEWHVQAVSEFLDGGDLRSLLDSQTQTHTQIQLLTWAESKCQLAIDIADALAYLHDHRGPHAAMEVVKARNVLIQCPSEPDQAQLLRGKLSVFAVTRMRSVFATTEAEAS